MSDAFSRVSSTSTLTNTHNNNNNNNKTASGKHKNVEPETSLAQVLPAIPLGPSYAPSRLPNFLYFTTFATKADLALYIFGIISALISGVGVIGLDLLYGIWSDAVNGDDEHAIKTSARTAVFGAIGIAAGMVIFCTSFVFCLSLAAERICSRMRSEYFNRVLHQDATYFQSHGSGEVTTRMIKDINVIQAGIGEKAGYVIWAIGTVIAGYVTALTKNAPLGGFLLTTLVVFLILMSISNYMGGKVSKKLFEYEGRSNSYVEQIFSNVRIVQSFAAENFVTRGYAMYQKQLQKLGLQKSLTGGFELSIMYFSLCALYPMAFWYGAKGVINDGADIHTVVVPFYNCLNAFFATSNILPHVAGLLESFSVQGHLKQEMEREPLIDPNQDNGVTFTSSSDWDATVQLRHVDFAYPSAPETNVIKDLSFTCAAGKTTALVGGSGAGKSTIPSLILREYDLPSNRGEKSSGIFIAGHNIKDFNLAWLRSQFAIVSQDPQLLTGTVWENVAHGLAGTPWEYRPGEEATESARTRHIKDLVREALIKADALEFVEALPYGMDTIISSGLRLSGGQTQRIAIARALIRKPRILVFDEGTSALDTATEKRVKSNLEEEQKSRQMTVIIIAHRLTTVQNADNIIAMSKGELIEEGTNKDLIEKHGFYYDLIKKQNLDETNPDKKQGNTAVMSQKPKLDTINETRGTFTSVVGPRSFYPQQSYVTEDIYMPPLAKTASLTTLEAGEAAKEHGKAPSIRRVLQRFVNPSIAEILVGAGNAAIVGSSFVICAWIIGEAVEILGVPNPVRSELTPWLWYFFAVFAVTTFTAFAAGWLFEWASVRISGRIWKGLLNHLLTQESGFYDMTSSGTLAASIASHANHISEGFGLILCQILITAANLLGSVIMVFILSWKLSVVALCPVLVLFLTGFVETMSFERLHKTLQPNLDEMSSFCNEHVDAIRTVALFGRQAEAVRLFNQISARQDSGFKYLFIGSLSFAASQGSIVILGGLSLWWSAQLLIRGEATVATLFTSYESALIAGFAAARAFAFVPDLSRAASAAKAIGRWMDRKPKVQTIKDDTPAKESKAEDGSNIVMEYEDVSFRYPARPEVRALYHVNLCIKEGQKVAFCGASGSGKSTAMQLLLRMYEAGRGRVLLDGKDVRSYALNELRSQMALVPQSTTLFEGTLRENICFGLDDISDAEIWDACEAANISDMIKDMPEKLDTQVGLKGNTFSGGQKQRLAIARAVLRKPRILLLDEATSALDSNSEAAVQEALKSVAAGRTTVTIAHRLSTIQDSDVICVFEKGEIVEMGNHESLMAQRNKYFKLVQAQS